MTTPEQHTNVALSNAPSCKTLTSKMVTTSKQQKQFSSPLQHSEPLSDARKKQMSMLTILNKSVKNTKKAREDPAAVQLQKNLKQALQQMSENSNQLKANPHKISKLFNELMQQ